MKTFCRFFLLAFLPTLICHIPAETFISAGGVNISLWSSTSPLPIGIYLHSCVTSSNSVYCVGGNDGSSDLPNVSYANLSVTGISSWLTTTSYPTGVSQESCVSDLSYIYCVGGDSNGIFLDSSYYALASDRGLGKWLPTTSYPLKLWGESCVVSSDYIYCVGGFTGGVGGVVNKVYFAPLSTNGIGAWQETTSYPINIGFESCVADSGYIYCIGGTSTENNGLNYTSSVYYAPLSPDGIGSWRQGSRYPLSVIELSCTAEFKVVYCVGGQNNGFTDKNTASVYYAEASENGTWAWQSATSYPVEINAESCIAYYSYIYCMGGAQNYLTGQCFFAHVSYQTETSVNCSPALIQIDQSTTCEAIVSTPGPAASGYIYWSSNASQRLGPEAFFHPASGCFISSSGNCSVTFRPEVSGPILVTAIYSGDSNNNASSGTFMLSVIGTTNETNSNTKVNSSVPATTSSTGIHGNGRYYWLSALVAVFVLAAGVAASMLYMKRNRARG